MKTSIQLKRIVMATSFALAVMVGAPVANHYLGFNGFDVISQAHAEDDGGGKGKMGTSGKGSGSKQDKGAGDHGSDSSHGKKDTKVTGSFMGKGDEKRDPTATLPDYAGVKGGKSGGGTKPAGAGSKKGDLYGDTYVLIRYLDTGLAQTETLTISGVPTVYPLVQAYKVNADGTTTLLVGVSIPRDPTTGDLKTTLADGTVVTSAAVELSRLSVSRAPSKVASKSLTAVTDKLAVATTVTFDFAGRLVIDGATVDSPWRIWRCIRLSSKQVVH